MTSDVAAVEDFIINNLSDFLGSLLGIFILLIAMCMGALQIWRPLFLLDICNRLIPAGAFGDICLRLKPDEELGLGAVGPAAVFIIPLIALAIIPVMALITNYFTGRIKAASKRLRSSEGELASAAQEMLGLHPGGAGVWSGRLRTIPLFRPEPESHERRAGGRGLPGAL